ncbi:MAG: GGDEF domain-containing response regulator [Spirochaetes bacterium]|nr:GGDEF domain-containing response regulator [Spirochaetota bacterium]
MKETKKQHIVLVVASDSEEIGSIIHVFKEEEYDFITAKSVPEALSNITYRLPHLIISEAELPQIDGFAFLEIIRKGVKTRFIPFVFITESKDLKDRVHAYQTGADAILVKPIAEDELRAIVSSRIRLLEEFYQVAVTDELTRLSNRREFLKKFNEEINKSEKQRISLALLDLDHFKQINDIHGHQMGDNVLMTFADVIKSICGERYIPARFGGEEFVLLFPGLNALEAKEVVEQIRSIFCGISFKGEKQKVFRANFSAGIAEYPQMANNLSHLLSKADHALYAAKNEGRGRTLVYSPLMGRNDRFWEYLKGGKEIFLTKENADVQSGLLYLPKALDLIINLDFEIRSIGTMAIRVEEIPFHGEVRGRQNLHYEIRNLVNAIIRSCENNFASDTFYCRASVFHWDFVILFPSIVDFSFNIKKFKDLCSEIFQSICSHPASMYFDLGFECDVIYYNKKRPWVLLDEINRIIANINVVYKKRNSLEKLRRTMRRLISGILEGKINIKMRYFYNTFNFHREYQYVVLFDGKSFTSELDVLIADNFTPKKVSSYLLNIRQHLKSNKSFPLMIPWIDKIDLMDFVELIANVFTKWDLLVMINESQISNDMVNQLTILSRNLPSSVSIGIDNCFIGQDLLHALSSFECKVLCFSENIIRNIHFFKERIKIVNGAKIFADQLGVRVMAKNILSEEEYIIVRDLGIYYASGDYMEFLRKTTI